MDEIKEAKLDMLSIKDLEDYATPTAKNLYTERIIASRKLVFVENLEQETYFNEEQTKKDVDNYEDCNLITSASKNSDVHLPVFDFDFQCFLLPSSPGKNHLIINKILSHADYKKLIDVLYEVGLIEPGYKKSFTNNGFTAIRRIDRVKGFANTEWQQQWAKVTKTPMFRQLFTKYRTLMAENQAQRQSLDQCHKLMEKQQLEIEALKKQLKEKETINA